MVGLFCFSLFEKDFTEK